MKAVVKPIASVDAEEREDMIDVLKLRYLSARTPEDRKAIADEIRLLRRGSEVEPVRS
ncbi:hypothetical protein [Dokdonella soli]|uniref:Uncharacterized protein n=1 Tax=Dokdonella soli TaxID=529810 RepID=A0ABN1IUA2_9GAMM